MADVDLGLVLKRVDAMQKSLREGLQLMQLRDDQREAAHQGLVQTLTRQMVEVAGRFDEDLRTIDQRMDRLDQRMDRLDQRMDRLDQRMLAIDERLNRFQTVLTNIARRLDA